MTCHNCRIETVKAGRARDGSQRHKCQQCGKRYTDAKERLLGLTPDCRKRKRS